MDISFSCERCGQRIVIEDAAAGLSVQCPKCGASLTVPPLEPRKIAARGDVSSCPALPLSSSKLAACKDCGTPVSVHARSCPRCGAPLKRKHGVFYYVFWGALSLIATVLIVMTALLFAGAFFASSRHGVKRTDSSSRLSSPKEIQLPPLTEEARANAEALLPNVWTNEDDVEGGTWYRPFVNPEKNQLFLYFGKPKNAPPPRCD
jgi:predicted RNA-binding Zn-ribbon protein involved in translation (DUF1610 family)